MGLAYYRVAPDVLDKLRPLIMAHESELVGPRARGFWTERPASYDYEGVQATAQELDRVGKAKAVEQLELSEVQAHSLSQLNIELPNDGGEFPPALFLSSVSPDGLRRQLRIARRRLGDDPDSVAERLVQRENDPRFAAYLDKQVTLLREALPLVWHFYQRAADAGNGILVVDLRARDLDIPDEVELVSAD